MLLAFALFAKISSVRLGT